MALRIQGPLRPLFRSLWLGASLLLTGCAWLAPDPLPPPVRQALAAQQLPPEALAFAAWPLDAPAQRLHWQAERPMAPASTMKVVTAIVALDRLGPNWRGRTELLAHGALGDDGVLDGSLVLRGGADADLDWGALWQLLRTAREAGIRELRGGLRFDRSLFRPAREDLGLPPFDEAPEFPYNVIPDALHLNGQLLTLRLQSDGSTLRARFEPAWPGLTVDASAITLSDAPCANWEDGWQLPQVQGTRVALQGSFPRECAQAPALQLIDRDAVAAAALLALWHSLGGVAADAGPGDTPAGARLIASHSARPLAELLRGVVKRSDNPLTRLVYLRLGTGQETEGQTTRAAADARVRDWLRRRSIDDADLVLDNGSGLSRSERLRPQMLAQMIAAAAREPYAPELVSGLPLAGFDGTLSRRLKGTAAEQRARLKTGTLRNADALAGFVTDASGRQWVVAAMVNDDSLRGRGRPVLDALMVVLAGQGKP